MSKNKNKIKREQVKIEEKKLNDEQVAKMVFKEDKFYNDLTVPFFEKGKIYEVRGGDKIQRWLKRGGEIVEGQLDVPQQEENKSEVVENVYSEQKPYDNEPKEESEEEVKEEPKEEEEVEEISLDGEDE